jgi:hypothetical protein
MMRNGKLALKGLTKEEKDKIKEDKKEEQGKGETKRMENRIRKPKQSKKKTKPEFKYIDEVPKKTYKEIVYSSIPEKIIINHDGRLGKFFSYTNRHLKETKRLKYHALLKTIKTR